MPEHPFLTDIQTIRDRARRHLEKGSVTESYKADLPEYAEGETRLDMIKEDLVAERIAIETYSEIVRWLANDDPTSRRMIEDILTVEEEHADDLASLLDRLDTTA